ncbi:Muscarinic acetylcholine receptor gar-2 [Schistosoma japonicum]|nr:Muscarinic acetylcholine receptor gar-2 [Schistosoma japonicum]
MICISWIFPATLFTLIIFGWSYLTGESQREITKCDVSFTYYPVFNTTLTVGYFWITLIIMCSLYIGIYKVARRLQKKSLESSKRLVQFLTKVNHEELSQSHNSTNPIDDDNSTTTNLTLRKYNNNNNKQIIHRRERTNKHFCYETQQNFNESFDTVEYNFTSTKPCKIDTTELYPLTVTDENQRNSKKESHVYEIDSKEKYTVQNDTNKCNFEYGSEISGCSNIYPSDYPTSNNSAEIKTQLSSIIEKPQLFPNSNRLIKYEDSKCELYPNEYSPSISDDDLSLPTVDFYVPSPKVSMSSPIQSGQSISPKNTQSDDNSPVWIKKDACYDSGLNLCEYELCRDLLKCQAFIHEENICQNGLCVSDSASWNQCIQTCCLSEKCEYSDCIISSDNISSTCYNQSTITDNWCIRLMHKWDKSLNSTVKSSYVLNPRKYNSFFQCKQHDKFYPTELQTSYNMNMNQEICPLCHINKNNNHFIQQQYTRKSDSQLTIEQTKFKYQYYCCIPSLKTMNTIPLNTIPPQGQSSTTNSKTQSNDNSDICRNDNNSRKTNRNKLSLKYKYKQQSSNSQQQQQTQQNEKSLAQRRQTTFTMFQSLSNIDMQNRKHARKALKTISLILGAFMICWTPYHIIVLIKGFCDDISTHTSCVNIHLYNLSYWLCYMNSPINPFCYALSNISFRRTFFRILRCDFQKR